MASACRRIGIVGALSLLASCQNWTRFDDIQEDTPVASLKKPDSLKGGFGVTLATTSVDGKASRVLVGGSRGKSRAAIFDLGSSDKPRIDARDTGACSQRERECFFADQPAGLAIARTGSQTSEHCYAVGVGREFDDDDWGILGRCADQTEYFLDIPQSAVDRLIDEIEFQGQAEPFVLASDKDAAAALVAGAPNQRIAWFYGPERQTPIELVAPGSRDESYGSAVASARLTEGARLLAVGAPEADRVWLFRWNDGDASAEPVGCLGGPDGFGRTLATGPVDSDDLDDLVIADEETVSVFSGAALELLEPADFIECSLAALPPGGLIASFQCGSGGSITGCPGGFGEALAVGDLDGDGDGEVVVGVPEMTTREEKRAGAVLVYDVEGEQKEALTEAAFWSSRESGDRLGFSVATARITGRDVIVAGAPGSGRTAVFYCLDMVPDSKRGNRCH